MDSSAKACRTCGQTFPLTAEHFACRAGRGAARDVRTFADDCRACETRFCPKCEQYLHTSKFAWSHRSKLTGEFIYKAGPCKECRKPPPELRRQWATVKGQRRCRDCKVWKPLNSENFHTANTNSSGFQSACKSCNSKRANDFPGHAARQGVTLKEFLRNRYIKQKPSIRKTYLKMRYTDVYRARVKASNSKRRTRVKGNGGSYTGEQWLAKLASYKNRCHYCGKVIKGTPEADHLIPVARGGSSNISNIVPSCGPCNRSKSAKLPHEWMSGRLL